MELGLQDRVALITGASGGIGAAIARALTAEGARAAAGYHSRRDAAERLAADIERAGGTALIVPHDLRNPDSIRAAVDTVVRTWGRLDILVTSAWVHPEWPDRAGGGPSSPEMWQGQLGVNAEGTAWTGPAGVPPSKGSR